MKTKTIEAEELRINVASSVNSSKLWKISIKERNKWRQGNEIREDLAGAENFNEIERINNEIQTYCFLCLNDEQKNKYDYLGLREIIFRLALNYDKDYKDGQACFIDYCYGTDDFKKFIDPTRPGVDDIVDNMGMSEYMYRVIGRLSKLLAQYGKDVRSLFSEPEIKELATKMGVQPKTLREYLVYAQTLNISSLDHPLTEDDDTTLQDAVPGNDDCLTMILSESDDIEPLITILSNFITKIVRGGEASRIYRCLFSNGVVRFIKPDGVGTPGDRSAVDVLQPVEPACLSAMEPPYVVEYLYELQLAAGFNLFWIFRNDLKKEANDTSIRRHVKRTRGNIAYHHERYRQFVRDIVDNLAQA